MIGKRFVAPKLFVAMGMIACLILGLIYAGVKGSAQSVVTVHELLQSGSLQRGGARERLRLGARVMDREIIFRTEPDLLVTFSVTDPVAAPIVPDVTVSNADIPSIKVRYHGVMPNTLKPGRDVILEGRFDGEEFEAKTLLTQCPSKYEPPEPTKRLL